MFPVLSCHQAMLAAGLPVDQVSEDRDGAVTFVPSAGATAQQITACQNFINTFDTSASAEATREAARQKLAAKSRKNDMILKAILSVVLDEVNLIRSKLSPPLAARTIQQFQAAVDQKIDAM